MADTAVAEGGNGMPVPGVLDGLLGYRLRRAQVAVFADFAQTMAGYELTPGQFGTLALIAANPGLSQTALGTALGIDRSSVVPLIDKLERRRLVERAPHARDRRSHALRLTDEGAALFETARAAVARHEAHIFASLAPAERETLARLLDRVSGV
ncbi:MAG TPA: MarR family transcriptional regulator [Aliidongia sp.]|uniref:MarR family winged helix-turn-helix transcriptional regulator n=1 Tax=Aliidongia sp. TaxID=1914230 RepID=UPI002DDD41E9|nr:MarR family transcriptional regulator [Aliidongia sp.]HEV2675254.1 MarR family transcriptional regulator [Aliidongia sp.]